ncbi:MAG: acetyl-CoA C-acyltransferase, partial [Chloroflexota bacterium]
MTLARASSEDIVIVGAARTAIGRFQGGLRALTAPQLGAAAIRAALERAGVEPSAVDEVLMGCVLQSGLGQAPARQAALAAGLPVTIGATTINKICGSGLKAAMLGAAMLRAGDADVIVAGGMESMTNAPYLLPQARGGYRLGDGVLVDGLIRDGLWCTFTGQHMGHSAEWIAEAYGISRTAMDEYALESHR